MTVQLGFILGVVATSLALVLLGRSQRGRRRRLMSQSGTFAFLIASPIAVVALADIVGYSFSDATAALGIAFTILFALLGSHVTDSWRRVTVGVVITSRVPFFTEVRRGLREGLDGESVRFFDEYDSSGRALEDLADFMPCLRRVMRHRPDYLVVACPSDEAASSPETIALLRSVTRGGGAVFFIENGPAEALLERSKCSSVTRVTADSVAGASVLAKYLASEYPAYRIHLLCGPEHSQPAQMRSQVFAKFLEVEQVVVADMSGWTRSGTRAVSEEILSTDPGPTLLVCGNDSMALGAADAVRSAGRNDVVVVGYDGVRQVLAAIAEPSNPIVATLRTPPAAYGHEIAGRIKDLLSLRPIRELHDSTTVQLFVDESHLVTRHNVEALLAELWS